MKRIIISLILSVSVISAFGQAGSLSQSVYRSRVNDSTSVTAPAGYGLLYYNNQRASPAWLFSNNQGVTWQKLGSGSGGAVLSVTGDGVINTDPTNPVMNLTSSRTFTTADDLDQTDNLHIVYANSGAPFNITVDLLSVGTQVSIVNKGAATVTLVAGAGVTLSGGTIPLLTGERAFIIYETPATPDVYKSGPITLTGDVTGTGNTTVASILATVNSNVGSFGTATQSPTLTVNGKGLITGVSNTTITPAVGSITGLGTGVGTWLGTPSWTNFTSAITGTAPFWKTSGTTTLTAPNTIAASASNIIEWQFPNLLSTSVSGAGLWLHNTTNASNSVQQYPPSIVMEGSAWNPTVVASQKVKWKFDASALQGDPISSQLFIGSSVNGGAYKTSLIINPANSSNNSLTLSGGNIAVATNTDEMSFTGPGGAVARGFGFTLKNGTYGVLTGSSQYSMINYVGGWAGSYNGTGSYIQHYNNPTYNLTNAGGAGTIIGYDYAPVLTSMLGIANHYAWRNTSGKVLINGTTITASTEMDVRGVGTTTDIILRLASSADVQKFAVRSNGQIDVDKTMTTAGTTGAQTIDKSQGSVNFAGGASTLVVTNSLATTTSNILVTVYGADATAISARVTRASGSFTITLNAAATAETAVGFFVFN